MNATFQTNPGSIASWKRTLAVMFLAQLVAMIGFSSIFPFLPLYVHSLGTVSGLSAEFFTGLVFSGQAFSMMIAAPIWGALADRWGRKLMVERALFGGAVILGLMALARSAEELVLLRMLQGLISGIISAANALVAAVVPRARSGYAMGLMQVAMGLGLGLGPVVGGVVADAYGYRAAFYITAVLLVIAGVVVFFGVEEKFAARDPKRSRAFDFTATWRRVLSAPGVRLMYALRFINQMGRIIFIPILPLLVLTLIDNPARVNSFTGIVIGAASSAMALCSIYLGRMGDRSGHRRIVITCLFGAGLLFFLQGLVNAGWQLLVLQMLYGVALGGTVTGISALLAIHSQSGDEGAVYGLDSSITSGARVIGPLLGVGIAAWMGVRAVFLTAGLLYSLAALLAFLSLPRPKR